MRVNVVSDVHGRADALARAGEDADAVICLGDLILFVDYADHSQGIFPDLFGAERAKEFIDLRTAGRFTEARAMSADLWAALGGDPREHIDRAVRAQYAQIFAAMPTPAYLTYGNVDLPALWPDYARPGHHILDGQTIEIGGLTFGFVGGGLRTAYRTPYEIDDEEYARKVEALGHVDVLCSHIPPAVPDLLYDTVARRFERGSEATLAAIRRTQPRYALFGHVHQPLVARTRIGRTECINVGHFRGRGTPFALEW
ncbi:metallophosphoesterase [Acrocarpospora phusangensis]|uniref:Metallophosphoesterase n=1 Tax=Acrocarpospora phusangensis TaxID=1070424 RepID=A0A919UM82_9ACTN|nr:metallophosphoesterase [Acrocarpospora phusangensis]GIH23042.1 metallophosphoesterase [Acrocarpospora phusangensis]